MTSGVAFAKAVAERAALALVRNPYQTETFSIGPLAFQLTSPTGRVGHGMGRAFLSGTAVSDGDVAHGLTVWDGTTRDEVPPKPPWEATAPEPLGFVTSHSNENVRCAIDIHTDSLIVSNFASGCSYTWYPSLSALPAWAKASPFRIPLSWLCNRHRLQIVHGAAVGVDGRAVLLVGDGGSGKSTTALACALAGLEYLGDDYCAVEPHAGKVHMVYRTAKLFSPSLDLLPAMADHIDNRNLLHTEKGVAFLDPSHVKLTRSASLSAILLPRVGDAKAPLMYPARREDVIKAVLPSTIGGLMGGTHVTPGLIMALVRSVPAYHLVLRPDMPAVVDAVAARSMAA